MRTKIICLSLLFGLSGCIVLGGDSPPQKTTIVVPPGSACTNSDGTPCQPQ